MITNGISDLALYEHGRQGQDFRYSIPVTPGLYTLRLKFAESKYEWFFERPFNLSINGRQVLRNFDICQAARGPDRPYDRVFRYLVPDAAGHLVLRFWGGDGPLQQSREALVNAIEIVPALKPVIRINAGSDTEFVDWSSFVWAADSHFQGGKVIRSNSPVTQAAPTLYDQALYQECALRENLKLLDTCSVRIVQRAVEVCGVMVQATGAAAHEHRD